MAWLVTPAPECRQQIGSACLPAAGDFSRGRTQHAAARDLADGAVVCAVVTQPERVDPDFPFGATPGGAFTFR